MNQLQEAMFRAILANKGGEQGPKGAALTPYTLERIKQMLSGQTQMPVGYAGTPQGREWNQYASDPDM